MAMKNQRRSGQGSGASGLRVPQQRYGLIEWNGLSGFVSYGLEPSAITGKEPDGNGIEAQAGKPHGCELGRVSEPMN